MVDRIGASNDWAIGWFSGHNRMTYFQIYGNNPCLIGLIYNLEGTLKPQLEMN